MTQFPMTQTTSLDTAMRWADDCPEDSSGNLVRPGTPSSAGPKESFEFKAVADPGGKALTITYELGKGHKGRLELIDMMGRTVLDAPVQEEEGQKVLNTSELSRGVYVVHLRRTDGNTARRKVFLGR